MNNWWLDYTGMGSVDMHSYSKAMEEMREAMYRQMQYQPPAMIFAGNDIAAAVKETKQNKKLLLCKI